MNYTPPIRLVAGLSNPGQHYANTRHNAGAWLVRQFLHHQKLSLKKQARFEALYAVAEFPNQACPYLIPTTFINQVGRVIKAWGQFYQISPGQVLIAHDDIDLSPGITRFKYGGGSGGHNGLKDIINQLHTQKFWRLRIGIGHPGERALVHDYVLGKPNKADFEKIQLSIQRTIEVLPSFLSGDSDTAQRILHTHVSQ